MSALFSFTISSPSTRSGFTASMVSRSPTRGIAAVAARARRSHRRDRPFPQGAPRPRARRRARRHIVQADDAKLRRLCPRWLGPSAPKSGERRQEHQGRERSELHPHASGSSSGRGGWSRSTGSCPTLSNVFDDVVRSSASMTTTRLALAHRGDDVLAVGGRGRGLGVAAHGDALHVAWLASVSTTAISSRTRFMTKASSGASGE